MTLNIKEAYQVLEVPDNISDDDLKKKYKELAKIHHPDVSKDQDKFKKINEAYQLITDYRTNPDKYEPKIQPGNGFWGNVVDFGDIFFGGSDFFRNTQERHQTQKPVNLKINLSFHEAVLGCSKEIKYKRNLKCSACQGVGHKSISNGCDKCDGFGRSTNRNGGVIFQLQCPKCMGKGVKKNKCEKCNGKCSIEEDRSGNINIPAGSKDKDILRLIAEGNFSGQAIFGDAYTDVHIELSVESYKDLTLIGKDVHSNITISLLEALEGVTKEVETIYGNKEIKINSRSKHLDQIKIPRCGVQGTSGFHIVTINIEYPDDISNLIGVLKDVVPNSM